MMNSYIIYLILDRCFDIFEQSMSCRLPRKNKIYIDGIECEEGGLILVTNRIQWNGNYRLVINN